MKEAPRRTCVGCRTTRAKHDLVRIAATPDGVRVDPDHVLPGRGAYVCPRPQCIEMIERTQGHTLRRALRTAQQHDPATSGITVVLSDLHRRVDPEAGHHPDDTTAPVRGTTPEASQAPAGPGDPDQHHQRSSTA